MNPILFGYLSVRLGAPQGTLTHGKRALRQYARRQNYRLGTIFVERDANRPLSALASLIRAANRDDVRLVAVPAATDLGSLPRVQQVIELMLARDADVRVIVVGAGRR